MNELLLDTHALLWCLADDPALSATARTAVLDPEARIVVSAASAWEISTKHRLGRLDGLRTIASRLDQLILAADYNHLHITFAHAQRAGAYASAHKDPFDRMLAAQAEIESLTLVTADRSFAEFPVATLW
ncbi:type II toxin-antitoxin system VapC family toxin [Candidatus Poriferisodalis sp.]|uniref:type II toxin-antitoxin system VapC family toxin n=1 Tax=Candidatus Poriferisodalis sp. TaxID=3101277 RepID=UPI003C6F2208